MFRKTLRNGLFAGFVFFIALAGAARAQAAEPKLIGEYGAWSAYTLVEGGQKSCYMVSKPASAKGDYTSRGDVYALVTHRPAKNTKDVFTYITGYTYKSKSEASISVDGKRFELFTQDDTAWTPDAVSDSALALAIRKGSKMVVKGTSSRGTLTTDTFSLKGSGDAYEAISKACGVSY